SVDALPGAALASAVALLSGKDAKKVAGTVGAALGIRDFALKVESAQLCGAGDAQRAARLGSAVAANLAFFSPESPPGKSALDAFLKANAALAGQPLVRAVRTQ